MKPATVADVRAIALSLPGAVEAPHFDYASFRVGGRIFATLPPDDRHLHAFVRETEPTTAEWERAIAFLTATGQACTDTRQEFVLLSDVLGVSML